ncbi:MAG TPA: CoA transferase [Dehalococcoidia bacterium]|nr:CoA transferase [Dehalococcoidia bacterium]
MNGGSVLSGYRVLDLTDDKGRLCPRYLADMGAEVIRIEEPGKDSGFHWQDLGKRSITLNIELEPGREILKRLVKTADVLVESHPPGYLEALGLGYSLLSKINPRLVVASVTGFGQSGPYRDYKSSDIVASALGGQLYLSGEPDWPPLKPFGDQSYYLASILAAIGVLLALLRRHTSGRGQHVDVSLQECVAAALDHALVRYFYQGEVAKRQGGLHWNNAFNVFPAKDGYVLLSLFYQWHTLVEWLDSEGMAEDLTDEKWRDRDYRLQHIDHVIDVLGRWAKSHDVAGLVVKGQSMRFPWAEVASIPGLLASPQLEERGFWVEVEDSDKGKKYRFPGAPCSLSRSPWKVGNKAPGTGEHNREIYQELGLSEKEVEALIKEGVI